MSINLTRLFSAHLLCFLFLLLQGTGEAKSFPFRNIKPGDSLPAVTLEQLKGGSIELASFQGQPLVLVFWGADLKTKRQRSLKAFNDIKTLLPYLSENSATTLSINVQGDDKGVINGIIQQTDHPYPALLDLDRQAYGSLGIFIMPSILLVDKTGKVSAGMGYSHDFVDRLQGELSIMLGQKTRAEMEAELRPEIIEKSKEEKASRRQIQMGRIMLEQGMPERAMEKFLEALKLQPNSSEAHIELACTYLQIGRLEEAETALEKGLELSPESLKGQLCDARLSAALGYIDEAIADLQALLLRNSRKPELHYNLGLLFEQKGDLKQASGKYRKAYELRIKQKK